MKEALEYWSTVLDMDFTVDNNPETCNLEVLTVDEDSNRLAYTIMPHSEGFEETVKINIRENVQPTALLTILIHELWHIFRLCHTRDRLSAIYNLVHDSPIEMVSRFRALHRQPDAIIAAVFH
jgi:hypothetical protein